MAEHVILVAGPMGAGKTTAIRSLSEIEVVSTEAANTDRETADKETTTVALDYGEITVGEDDKVRMYGVPGQNRFDVLLGGQGRGVPAVAGQAAGAHHAPEAFLLHQQARLIGQCVRDPVVLVGGVHHDVRAVKRRPFGVVIDERTARRKNIP